MDIKRDMEIMKVVLEIQRMDIEEEIIRNQIFPKIIHIVKILMMKKMKHNIEIKINYIEITRDLMF